MTMPHITVYKPVSMSCTPDGQPACSAPCIRTGGGGGRARKEAGVTCRCLTSGVTLGKPVSMSIDMDARRSASMVCSLHNNRGGGRIGNIHIHSCCVAVQRSG
jgi:hypothetical protein